MPLTLSDQDLAELQATVDEIPHKYAKEIIAFFGVKHAAAQKATQAHDALIKKAAEDAAVEAKAKATNGAEPHSDAPAAA